MISNKKSSATISFDTQRVFGDEARARYHVLTYPQGFVHVRRVCA